jgi:hypothetical protein
MKQIYIECAGMRIPYNWTPEQLKFALRRRKIKLDNEAEIRYVFGHYIDMIRDLNNQILIKQRELYLLPAKSETIFKPAPAVPMPIGKRKSKKERG